MYQSSSRKYRPQTFQAILGQDRIVTTLKNALKLDRVAHAYLFCGSRGTGKTTLARLFAKALNCHHLSSDQEPCGSCPSCVEISSGHSLDVLEIDGASNRGIDDIRQINETVGYASSSGKYKIYIIDEVHMLTKEAFNALLKTLEEPPRNVKFFFATTEPHKVLPTIISRCQRFDLRRIPAEVIVSKLKAISRETNVTVEDEALHLIAHLSEGGLRDAESLFDQLACFADGPITYDTVSQTLGLSPLTLYFRLDQAISQGDLSAAFDISQEVFSSGKDLTYFLEGLIEHFRTLLLFKLGENPAAFLTEENKKNYVYSASHYTEEQCLYLLDYLIQWHKELSRTPFKRITLEMVLLHLLRSRYRISLPSLVQRLTSLEGKKAVEEAPQKPSNTPLLPPVEKKAEPPKAEPLAKPSQRRETVMRFAAVELEGIIK